MLTAKQTLSKFEARVWEKAEHWYFYATVDATDEHAALTQLRKDYPKRSYTVSQIRQIAR